MEYQVKNFDHLLGTPGISDQLLQNHFTLYEGYVKNINTLAKLLAELVTSDKSTENPNYSELKRRFGWEFDGMRLHELYFGNLAKSGTSLDQNSELSKKIADSFGSFNNWEADFRSTGAMRGIGWVILYQDVQSGRLFNVWINEHDGGHLAGCHPLLVMDVFEHAYMLDYGTKRAGYIDAFFKAIDWSAVEKRLL